MKLALCAANEIIGTVLSHFQLMFY